MECPQLQNRLKNQELVLKLRSSLALQSAESSIFPKATFHCFGSITMYSQNAMAQGFQKYSHD